MHQDRGVVFYHTHSCAQCFEKDVVHLAQQWYNEGNLSFTRGFDPQALRLCIRLLQPLGSLVTQAKLQNTPQLWSASLTCVGRLWRSRHNTIDAILIQWHVNELRGILKLLRDSCHTEHPVQLCQAFIVRWSRISNVGAFVVESHLLIWNKKDDRLF